MARIMVGRTHLQDATPIRLGQVISGWVAQIDLALDGIRYADSRARELAIGGTAVGTGLNAHPKYMPLPEAPPSLVPPCRQRAKGSRAERGAARVISGGSCKPSSQPVCKSEKCREKSCPGGQGAGSSNRDLLLLYS